MNIDTTDLDDFDFDEAALKAAEKKREQQLAKDEKQVITDEDDCEGCKI